MFLSIMSCAVSTADSKFGRKSTDRRLHRSIWLRQEKYYLDTMAKFFFCLSYCKHLRKPPNKHQFRNKKLNEKPRGNNFLLIGISRIVILKSISKNSRIIETRFLIFCYIIPIIVHLGQNFNMLVADFAGVNWFRPLMELDHICAHTQILAINFANRASGQKLQPKFE